MQDRPDKIALLAGVARFLAKDVAGAIVDPATRFRVKIAAHLVATVARESASEDQVSSQLLPILTAMGWLDDAELPSTAAGRADRIRDGEAALARAIRAGDLDDAALEGATRYIKAALAAKLRVSNPRFSLDPDIEA